MSKLTREQIQEHVRASGDERLRAADRGADLSELELQDSDLGGSDLSESFLGRTNLTGINLENVSLEGASLVNNFNLGCVECLHHRLELTQLAARMFATMAAEPDIGCKIVQRIVAPVIAEPALDQVLRPKRPE
jgi:hypothetical protein